MNGSSPDTHKIAAPYPAIFHRRFNGAKQVFVRRRGFKNHRRSDSVGIIDNEIDLIFMKAIFFIRHGAREEPCLFPRAAGCFAKPFDILIERRFDFVEILLHVRLRQRTYWLR